MSINASNSSLNQILREISRQTGMKITGGVREERVFGHYGPAPVADILTTLIDGTGTNMVLRQTASNTPEELILTPRSGGVTPPNPNAPGFDQLDQPFAVPADIALNFGQMGKFLAFGLGNVEDVDGAKAIQLRLRLFLIFLHCGLS